METKINIAEILKNKPEGTKLYTDAFGELSIENVYTGNKFGITLLCKDGDDLSFYNDGRYSTYGEPILVPSKAMRDWSKFKWKKGDVLVSNDGKIEVIFEKFRDDTYQSFIGKHHLDSLDENLYYLNEGEYPTFNFNIETEDAAQTYINTIEKRLGGKLNLETLEIEKQLEFKDGDIVVCGKSVAICRKIYKHTLSFYVSLNEMFGLLFAGEVKSSEEYRFATEEEKKQLFSALANEGKVWIPEKKQIVDLKPKVELKPFDKVLVRDRKSDKWRVNLYGYKSSDGPYYCVYAGWNYCIPYEGNEHLLGTTENVGG